MIGALISSLFALFLIIVFTTKLSMIFFYIASSFGLLGVGFDWISSTLFPIDSYVVVVYALIPFLFLRMIVKSIFINTTKS